MNQQRVDQVARAILYEGYILYPYRPSLKNQQRWTFGGLYPEAFNRANASGDASFMQTECLVCGSSATTLKIKVRFLHLLSRRVEAFDAASGNIEFVDSLEVDGTRWQTWQEATEREVELSQATLSDPVLEPCRTEFAFPAWYEREPLRDARNVLHGELVRDQQAIQGTIELSVKELGESRFRITVGINNLTPLEIAGQFSRERATLLALVSTHTILEVNEGEFMSLIDPPDSCREDSAQCHNIGAWPVLVGNEGDRNMMLSSPIILYDYPQIAPESPGDFFDGTEIDEMLTLRIMTLTDDEKRAMGGIDKRSRALLGRTEAQARDQMMKLHGSMAKGEVRS